MEAVKIYYPLYHSKIQTPSPLLSQQENPPEASDHTTPCKGFYTPNTQNKTTFQSTGLPQGTVTTRCGSFAPRRTWVDCETASSSARARWQTSSLILAYMASAVEYLFCTISPSSGLRSLSCGPIFSSLSMCGLCSAMDSRSC